MTDTEHSTDTSEQQEAVQQPLSPLLPQHAQMLAASAIGGDVIKARGYRTIEAMSKLEQLGFGKAARRVPTLMMPIWSVSGDIGLYHHRPDEPRIRNGKPAKYEFPHEAHMVVDVHPFLREMVRDPAVPLFITEGVKKADAAITAGLCCIAIPGVWNWRGTNEWGGKTTLPDWDGIAFKDKKNRRRPVYLVFDSDVMLKKPVYLALSRLGAFLESRGASIAYIYLPSGERGAKIGLDDYLASGRSVDDLLAQASRTLREPPAGDDEPLSDEDYARHDGKLPPIETARRHLRHMTQDTLDAIARNNMPPRLFAQSGSLVRIQVDENDYPAVQALSVAALRGETSHCANFVYTSQRGTSATLPPPAVIETIHGRGTWAQIPNLAGIVTAPVALEDATLLRDPGYHVASRLYYHQPKGFQLPELSFTPTSVTAAKELLEDLLVDFPFAERSSRCHALALVLLPFVRPLIHGPTPLHLIDAPQAGTGKSLLSSVCTDLFVPTPGVAMTSCPPTEEEWGKTLTSVFMAGTSHLIIDNARTLNSAKLFAALTTTLWKDRQMGGNEIVPLTNRVAWAATCNNVAGNDELTRRSIWIRLDAGLERPEIRQGFRHKDIRGHVQANRPQLVAAVLTLIGAWLAAGRPTYSGVRPPLGSFESWTSVMGGLLEHSGFEGFLENREVLRSRVDKDSTAWEGFITSWYEQHQEGPVSTAELLPTAMEWLAERLGDATEKTQKVKLGRLLGSHLDRVYCGKKVTNGAKITTGPSKGAAAYKLIQIAQTIGPDGNLVYASPAPKTGEGGEGGEGRGPQNDLIYGGGDSPQSGADDGWEAL